MLLDNHFERVPDFGGRTLHHFSCGLNICNSLGFNQAFHNKGLEKLQRHFLRNAALVHFKLGSYNYNRTAGIVNTLTEQILTEASLLTLKHIGKRLKRAVVRACYGLAASAVIDKGINRLLKHTLFVADDYIRRAQLKKSLQAVVTVDNTPVKIIQIARCETAAVQLNHRAEIRRNYRNNIKYHPLGTVARLPEGFKHLKTL